MNMLRSQLNNALKQLLALFITVMMVTQVGAVETVVYYHNDALGSPVAATDQDGNLLWKEEYKPYGERIRKEDGGTNDLWYTGKPHEDDLGLSYFGARWYDPNIGRFMAIDPVDFKESNIHSFNRYAYANNNPYKYMDPDGREARNNLSNPRANWKTRTVINVDYSSPTGNVKWYQLSAGTDKSSKGIIDAAGLMDLPRGPYQRREKLFNWDIGQEIGNNVGEVDYESDYRVIFPIREYEASKYEIRYNSDNPSEKTWIGPIKENVWRPDPSAKPTKVNSEKKQTGARWWFQLKPK